MYEETFVLSYKSHPRHRWVLQLLTAVAVFDDTDAV